MVGVARLCKSLIYADQLFVGHWPDGANGKQVNEAMAARDRELVELYSYPAHGSGVSTGSQNAVGNRLYGETTYRTVSQEA